MQSTQRWAPLTAYHTGPCRIRPILKLACTFVFPSQLLYMNKGTWLSSQTGEYVSHPRDKPPPNISRGQTTGAEHYISQANVLLSPNLLSTLHLNAKQLALDRKLLGATVSWWMSLQSAVSCDWSRWARGGTLLPQPDYHLGGLQRRLEKRHMVSVAKCQRKGQNMSWTEDPWVHLQPVYTS